MSDLSSLIDRIEASEGPDRELDHLIHAECFGFATLNPIDKAQIPYTASLDCAMKLVPEGCGWIAGWGQIRADEPMGGARITRNARFIGHHANYDTIAEAEAATPALALCACALKAREAQA